MSSTRDFIFIMYGIRCDRLKGLHADHDPRLNFDVGLAWSMPTHSAEISFVPVVTILEAFNQREKVYQSTIFEIGLVEVQLTPTTEHTPPVPPSQEMNEAQQSRAEANRRAALAKLERRRMQQSYSQQQPVIQPFSYSAPYHPSGKWPPSFHPPPTPFLPQYIAPYAAAQYTPPMFDGTTSASIMPTPKTKNHNHQPYNRPTPTHFGESAAKRPRIQNRVQDASATKPFSSSTIQIAHKLGTDRKTKAQATLKQTMQRYRQFKGQATVPLTSSNGVPEQSSTPQDFDSVPLHLFPRSTSGTPFMDRLNALDTDTDTIVKARKVQARRTLLAHEDTYRDEAGLRGERWGWLAHRRDSQGRSPESTDYDPTTLLIPEDALISLRGFNAQYWAIKSRCMDLVLFVRVGSFYELYDLDADIGIRAGLSPMSKSQPANMWKCGCSGISFGQWAAKVLALGYNVGRVEECGHRPKGQKLVIRRLVQIYSPATLIHGPVTECSGAPCLPMLALCEERNGILAACVIDVLSAQIGIAHWVEVDKDRTLFKTLLAQLNPVEVVVLSGHISPETLRLLKRHAVVDGISEFPLTISFIRHFTLEEDSQNTLLSTLKAAFISAGGYEEVFASLEQCLLDNQEGSVKAKALLFAIKHLMATKAAGYVLPRCEVMPIPAFTAQAAQVSGTMLLDGNCFINLELFHNSIGGREGTLMALLDRCVTPSGHRKLRSWISSPLFRIADIQERQAVVTAFVNNPDTLVLFQSALRHAPDCQRLLPKVAHLLSQSPSCCQNSEHSLLDDSSSDNGDLPEASILHASPEKDVLPHMCRLITGYTKMLSAVDSLSTIKAFSTLPPVSRSLLRAAQLAPVLQQLQQAVCFDACAEAGNIEIVSPGIFPHYDEARSKLLASQSDLQSKIAAVQQQLVHLGAKPSIVSKVHLTSSAGSSVEVEGGLLECPASLKSLLASIGDIVNENKRACIIRIPAVATAEKSLEMQQSEFDRALSSCLERQSTLIQQNYTRMLELVECMATLDVLAGFAIAAHQAEAPSGCTFCLPTFNSSREKRAILDVHGIWNPQLHLTFENRYVQPNDLRLGGDGPSTMLLTGANTGGKSTLLRASAILVIMAQLGCWVPARAAKLTPCDRIFTRIGAHDRIISGESTFAMEMLETSVLLRHAQPQSLVILDEVGRGTSTHDGEAIAASIIEWLAGKSGLHCRTLFATHYHSLCQDLELAKIVSNAHMATDVSDTKALLPLYKLMAGPAPQGSCGVNVAASAGIPSSIIIRAGEMATLLESSPESLLAEILSSRSSVAYLAKIQHFIKEYLK